MIECGWCGHATPEDRCTYCGRNPTVPWEHRDMTPPVVGATDAPGRPTLDPVEVRQKLRDARTALGANASLARIAEFLDVSETTVRRWRKAAG